MFSLSVYLVFGEFNERFLYREQIFMWVLLNKFLIQVVFVSLIFIFYLIIYYQKRFVGVVFISLGVSFFLLGLGYFWYMVGIQDIFVFWRSFTVFNEVSVYLQIFWLLQIIKQYSGLSETIVLIILLRAKIIVNLF